MVENRLSPHGGELVERVVTGQAARDMIRGLKSVPVRGQIATECVSIAYGFFSPLDGFMLRADVDSVLEKMTLASGYVWSIPIVFDISSQQVDDLKLKAGESLLLAPNPPKEGVWLAS